MINSEEKCKNHEKIDMKIFSEIMKTSIIKEVPSNLNRKQRQILKKQENKEKGIIEEPKIFFSLLTKTQKLLDNIDINKSNETRSHYITCYHKPKIIDIEKLKNEYNVNYFITLLNDKERPDHIFEELKRNYIEYTHIPLLGANISILLNKDMLDILVSKVKEIIDKIETSDISLNILIHCSAGIHRTGIVLYLILRCFGYSYDECMSKIKEIREITFNGVGKERIKFAEELFLKYFTINTGKIIK